MGIQSTSPMIVVANRLPFIVGKDDQGNMVRMQWWVTEQRSGFFAVGQFAVGQLAVGENVSFGLVKLGQIRLGSSRFFFLTANCPTAKNPRADQTIMRRPHDAIWTAVLILVANNFRNSNR